MNVDASSAVYVNVAVVSVVGLDGPEMMATVGAVKSDVVTMTPVPVDHADERPVDCWCTRARYHQVPSRVLEVVVTTSERVTTPSCHNVHFVAPGA